MTKPKLTIGMATSQDSYGVWQTITDLRLDHREVMRDVEIIVVDDSPCAKGTACENPQCHSSAIQRFLGWCQSGVQAADEGRAQLTAEQPAAIRYVPNTDAHGTTQSRNRIFTEAAADAVLCIDCHVKLWPESLSRLIDFYEQGQDDGNLLQGVLVYDDMDLHHTHFADVIRGNMWGVWDTDERGRDMDCVPFEIPAQGLGLFSSRKDAWLGFNSRFRGFGGEEWYIHAKYRKAGKKTLCLPWLRWIHRFMRVGGAGYTNDIRHRVRNYLIGAQELGLPVDRFARYFRDGVPEDKSNDAKNRTRISREEWDMLTLDLGIEGGS